MSKLLPAIHERRSDRHFHPTKPLEPETVEALLEAFRWAPSSNNRQPWRVLIASSPEAMRTYDDALSPGNQQWAKAAALKLVIIGVPAEQPDRNGLQAYLLDVGFAMENMMLQAYAMGLTIHAMAGFDAAKIRQGFTLPAEANPVALIAAGYRGRVEDLIEEVRAKDLKPRTRKEIAEFTWRDTWGNAYR